MVARLFVHGQKSDSQRVTALMAITQICTNISCKRDYQTMEYYAWSLLQFLHILSFFFHLLNHRRDRKAPVELAYPNFNIQARQVKALPASILVVEPISSRTRENLDALNDLTDKDDFLNTLFRLVESVISVDLESTSTTRTGTSLIWDSP